MRELPQDFIDHLATGETTLCSCWAITRKDGLVLGFTDHDRDLSFEGILFVAQSGLTGAGEGQNAGLAANHGAVEGIFDDARISAEDIKAHLYEGAGFRHWRVNWADVSIRFLESSGTLGEIRLGQTGFEAELRGPARVLEAMTGRIYQRNCDASLGDSRCMVDLNNPAFMASGQLLAPASDATLLVSNLQTFAADWFSYGQVKFSNGALAGQSFTIQNQTREASGDRLYLTERLGEILPQGTALQVFAGCDKSFAICRDKFSNHINFRGFPFMPGDDAVLQVPYRQDRNDGGKR